MGKGVKKNNYKAYLWAKRAAKLGHENSMLATAWFYFNGIGVTQNLYKAQEWYEKILAINPQNVSALFSLGQIYFLKHDYNNAYDYFYKSYKINKHAKACYYLGRLFIEKHWSENDISQAIFFLNIAAHKQIYEAKRLLKSDKMKMLMKA